MIANLFTVAPLTPDDLRRALARLLRVPPAAVDAADADGDQEGRDWDAPVLCTRRLLPPGDLALELDVTVRDDTAAGLTEGELALRLAAATGSSVLHPADLDLPSAYWAAVPDGRTVRCRLEPVDAGPDDTAYRVEAVEEEVPDLPAARVEVLPEILDREPIGTPVSDAFLATLPEGATDGVEAHVRYDLRVWERLVRRLHSGWAPSGRYREDLFRRDLRARDALERHIGELDETHAGGLRVAVAALDEGFTTGTEATAAVDEEQGERAGWWWYRLPHRTPWR
ncbi:hypothetical protein ACH4C6_03225 [Streptomyces sp. NPDC017943]|uniref:hypothetical protein n=1 Tax=Streptomyces sp. NPDC017943 TaxID=3365019 RepID=UPI0037ABAF6A